ncbi:MAG TPA: matrixin family metalloprotease [Kofleriaceae bacterium]|nr:matrixin family metalloprotease [Kofleriaceae bacterium]
MDRTLLLVALCAGLAPGRARGDVDPELAALTAGLPACEAARPHCIGIQLHVPVASGGDGLIAHADWLAVQLAEANRHFAPVDVGFQVVGADRLPAGAGHVATPADRDAVAEGRLTGKVIHVFITGQLDDVDQPGVIRGVTWHARGGDRKYVILSTAAPERVLAHELGHVFGLPHSRYAISIMNKQPRTEPPVEQRTFADAELAAMRPALRRLLRDQVIADVPR